MFFNTPKALWAGRADCGCFEMHVGGKLFNLTFLQKRKTDKWLPNCFKIPQMATRWFRNQSQIFYHMFQNRLPMPKGLPKTVQEVPKCVQNEICWWIGIPQNHPNYAKAMAGSIQPPGCFKIDFKWLSNIPKLSSNTKWLPNRYPGGSKRCSKSRFLMKMSFWNWIQADSAGFSWQM